MEEEGGTFKEQEVKYGARADRWERDKGLTG